MSQRAFVSVWSAECPACGRIIQGEGDGDVFDAHTCRVKPLFDRVKRLEEAVFVRTTTSHRMGDPDACSPWCKDAHLDDR